MLNLYIQNPFNSTLCEWLVYSQWFLFNWIFFVKVDPLSSPLEVAADKGHTEIVEKLISAGAVINYQNKVWELQAVREPRFYSLSILHSKKIIASNLWPL